MSEVAANTEKPAAKAEEKKEEGEKVFVYKGETVDASTLAGAGVVACEIPDVQVPEIKTGGWGGQAATKLPKLLFVTSIQESPLNKKSCLLSYVSYLSKKHPFQTRAISVPNDFKVKKLTGKQAAKMLDAYQKFEFDNQGGGFFALPEGRSHCSEITRPSASLISTLAGNSSLSGRSLTTCTWQQLRKAVTTGSASTSSRKSLSTKFPRYKATAKQ